MTNVWNRGPLHDSERLKGTLRRAAPRVYKPSRASSAHLNQKPLEFMERLVLAVTEPGDVVWEPFGGLASGSVAAVALGRRAFVAEVDPEFVTLGRDDWWMPPDTTSQMPRPSSWTTRSAASIGLIRSRRDDAA